MVHRILASAPSAYTIAADGGVYVARHYGRAVDVVIGDMDSIDPEDLADLASAGVTILAHPPEKDETDLELALNYAVEQGSTWVRILGAIGGRFDQTLANVYLMALPSLSACDVALAAQNQLVRLLRPGLHTLDGSAGDTVSLIPMDGRVTGIRTTGLQYPLHGEELRFGPARGVSNVMQDTTATVEFDEGLLLLVYTLGRA